MDPGDRDLVVLALAILSLDRPGWENACRRVAGEVFFSDPRVRLAQQEQFDEFRRLNADRWVERPL